MTRTLCDNLSEPVVQAYNDMEDEILALIGKQLGKYKRIGDTSKWRLRQLAMSGELDRRAVEIIASYAPGIDEETKAALYAAAIAEVQYTDAAIQEAVRRGILEGNVEQPASESAIRAVQAFQKQAEVDTNLVNTVMQYSAKSKYVNAVNEIADTVIRSRQEVLNVMGEGAAAAVSGQMSLQEATRHTIHKLARQGCPGFIDKAGREWTPEAYVSMDMRSTLANTAREAQDTRCTQYGVNLIAVSSHMGARPLCAPYQGRIFSRDGTSGVTTDGAGRQIEYIPLTQTSYGQPAGLFGINCGHQQYPFIPGVNVQRYFPYDEEQNAERYKEFQKQRAMERQIRSQKRECMMLQEAGDEEGLKDASKKLREYKDKYRDYSKEHGLGMRNDRTQVYGYDRSRSMKTTWSEGKAFVQDMKNKGVENPPSLANFRKMQYNDPEEYKLLNNYINSVDKGMLSPLAGFEQYKEYYKRIENELVGQTTSNGIVITGQSKHLLERIFGTAEDPYHNGVARSGVKFEDLKDALLFGDANSEKEDKDKLGNIRKGQKFIGKKATVSLNPDTGIIIQCQPRSQKKKK